MPLSDDPWIADNSLIDPERLHALGVITLFWNTCERMLFMIFCTLFRFPAKLGWIIAHDLGDLSLSERITELLKLQPRKADEETLVLHLLKVYDVCGQNRNMLTHFHVRVEEKGTDQYDFKFMRLKGPSTIGREFPSDLTDVRRIAADTRTLSVYMYRIYQALADRSLGQDVPLPPIVAPPTLLSLPLLEGGKAPQPQRPPSMPRLTEEEWIAKYRKESRPLPLREGE